MIDLARAIEKSVAEAMAERTPSGLGEAILKRIEAAGYAIRPLGGEPELRFQTVSGTPVDSVVRVEMDVPFPMTLWAENLIGLREMHRDPATYLDYIAGAIAHKMLSTIKAEIKPRLYEGLKAEAENIGKVGGAR